MRRYQAAHTVTTTSDTHKAGNICRLRLTLPVNEASNQEKKEFRKESQIHVDLKNTADRRKKRNGFVSESTSSEPPTLHLYSVPKSTTPPGTVPQGLVYGVVQRAENNHEKEVVVYEWSSHQLKEEMNYIKDVRVTLEKIRERMFGEYDDMKQKIKDLTKEMKVSSAQQEVLEHHSQTQAAAMDSLGDINSSLNASSLDLQKTLVDMTLEHCNIRDEMKSLKHSYNESIDKLKEKQQQLEAAKAENQLLKVKIESSQEANANVMREMTRKLYSQYDEKLQEEALKFKKEKEMLIGQTQQYLQAIEDASDKVKAAESKIEERDVKIAELDTLVQRMQREREQLISQLTNHEERIQRLDAKMEITASERERTQNLEEAATSLRERIKHLDDMVHCQQKKVKHMIEEIELLRKKVHYKDLLIQQLLERIALLEGENNELQDKMEYLMANQPKESPETKDAETSCDLPQSVSVNTTTSPVATDKGNLIWLCKIQESKRRTNYGIENLSPINCVRGGFIEVCGKFIARLPDRGKRILSYTEKVQAAIAQQRRAREKTSLLSAFKLEFEEQCNNVKERSQRAADPMNKQTLAPEGQILNKSPGSSAHMSETETGPNLEAGTDASRVEHNLHTDAQSPALHNSVGTKSLSINNPDGATSVIENTPNVIADGPSVPEDRNPKTKKIGPDSSDDLVDGLKMISIKDSGENNDDDSKTSLQDKVTLNHLAKKSHFVEIIENRAKNPAQRKERFQTNRLPSDSNSSTPNQSPGERALRLSAEERKAQNRKHLDDITAVTLPPIHHSPAQLLPLAESLNLQIAQKKSYEEKQAKLAAQKLFDKLNVKMAPYNPEGDSYMKYRDQDEDGAEE
ncbi:myocardial zonula adherens protein-like [Gastrophryne carolinensis]